MDYMSLEPPTRKHNDMKHNEMIKIGPVEMTMEEWLELDQANVKDEPKSSAKEKLHYIGFNLLAIALVVIVALICPKCSDADDRAIGLPEGAISK